MSADQPEREPRDPLVCWLVRAARYLLEHDQRDGVSENGGDPSADGWLRKPGGEHDSAVDRASLERPL